MEDLSSLKDYASQNSVPIMFDEGIEFIVNYIKENDVSFILEIGTAIGYSAIKFAQINPEIRIFTIEYDIERYQKAVENITDIHIQNRGIVAKFAIFAHFHVRGVVISNLFARQSGNLDHGIACTFIDFMKCLKHLLVRLTIKVDLVQNDGDRHVIYLACHEYSVKKRKLDFREINCSDDERPVEI